MTQTYDEYFHSRNLHWWRRYILNAYGVFAMLEGHPITTEEKRIIWTRLKHNHKFHSMGSYTALAQLASLMSERNYA